MVEAVAAGQSKVVALCDVDSRALATSADEINDLTNEKPKVYQDFRELFDREKPEVVIVATPDHWHALLTIAALKAGSHVFVEKPTGHTIIESKAMVKAQLLWEQDRETLLSELVGTYYKTSLENARIGGKAQPAKVDQRAQTDFILNRVDSVMAMGYIKKKPGKDAIDWSYLEQAIAEVPDEVEEVR